MRAADLAQELIRRGQSNRFRHCILLSGSTQWKRQTVLDMLDDAKACLVSSEKWVAPAKNLSVVSPANAIQLLGTEVDHLVIDASNGYDATAIGISSGCVRAGGMLLIFSPDSINHRLSGFDLYCNSMLQNSEHCFQIYEGQPLASPKLASSNGKQLALNLSQQKQAVEEICHVVSGQRKRPAVLIADRGRGKSAALGMAAAKLHSDGVSNILVTGRSRRSAEIVFQHCPGTGLKWVSADQLQSNTIPCELLLIDEAATLPLDLLNELLKRYSRIAMATTVNGYEGTGQGFMLRFAPLLDASTRGWRRIELTDPVRWNSGDPLELLTNQLLVQDAKLPEVELATADVDSCYFEQISQARLMENQNLLREIYSLLTLAHYQTRPSDLAQLLSHPRMQVFRICQDNATVGVALIIMEGGFQESLSRQIFTGVRRPGGHALPEILASQLGQPTAGVLRYARIMRIAIHPLLQRRGFGGHVLEQVDNLLSAQVDIIGSHFSATSGLVEFWRKNNFSPVRISQGKSVKTGGHSAVVLKSTSDLGGNACERAGSDFKTNFPLQLTRGLSDINAETIVALTLDNPDFAAKPNADVLQQTAGFCCSQRSADTLPGALIEIALFGLSNGDFNHPLLWVEKILLDKNWSDCNDCAGHDGWKSGNQRLRVDALQLMQRHFPSALSQFELSEEYESLQGGTD